MKRRFLMTILVLSTFGAYAQKQMNSDELVSQISRGTDLTIENVTFTGDIDLSNLGKSTLTGQYPENGKSVKVYTSFINQNVSFKNCTFKGKVKMCNKVESTTEKNEYRVEFKEDVTFSNCTFNNVADFELTNFNKAVSFEGSLFKEQPRFVRMGLYQKPYIVGLVLEKGCLFQFDQSKQEKLLTEKAESTKSIVK